MKLRFAYSVIVLCLLVCVNVTGYAQSCAIQVSADRICAGQTVNFVAAASGGTVVSYSWDFGDGFSGIGDTTSHTYLVAGTYTPALTVMFTSGALCVKVFHQLRVFALPGSKFTVTSEDTMCFKGNEICILDQSVKGPSNAPITKRTFQLSNGHSRTDFAPYLPAICYQDSVDLGGHLFSLVLEVTDSNNCVSRSQKTDSVLLYPKMGVNFAADYSLSCFITPVTFYNHTPTTLNAKSFSWIFGDGFTDNTNRAQTSHTYTSPGVFYPMLVMTDNNECLDTAFWTNPIESIFPDSTVYIDTPNQCYRDNIYVIKSNNNPFYTNAEFIYFDEDGNIVLPNIIAFSSLHNVTRFQDCGVYRIRMINTFPNCVTVTDTFINVYGPKAVMETNDIHVTNRDQCEVHDTVFFVTPNPYLSCQSGNASMLHIWNFDDMYAPACTTDTRNGINVGVNCNFSKDSVNVKHFYTPGQDGCYRPSLYMEDATLGCIDMDTISLALTAPDAHWDSTVTPVRRGLYYSGLSCIGSKITFMFDETLPKCGYEEAWLNVDSACGKDNWILADKIPLLVYDHVYQSTCDTVNGYITVGLIIKNGKDKNGKPCYDTAWYHNMLQMLPIKPFIDIVPKPDCKPFELTAYFLDSIQYNLANVRWDYKIETYLSLDNLLRFEPSVYDEMPPAWQYLSPPDSVLYAHTFTDTIDGVYGISVVVKNSLGCSRSDKTTKAVGTFRSFSVPGTVFCINDTIRLSDYIRYYSEKAFNGINPIEYWSDTARANAGKEMLWWDIGDGNGYVYTGSSPVVSYAKPGIYTISMIVKDSLGCYDTLVKPDLLHITEVQAKISIPQASYFCAPQIVLFTDSSMVIDSVGSTASSLYDAIASWSWNFGDSTSASVLQHAAHNYTANGLFYTILTVKTVSGCTDKDTVQLSLKGPQPSFIITDTMGCAPFHVKFDNTTNNQLKSWTWYFGDPANQTMITLSDSDVLFTYTQPGVYSIKLLGLEDIFNPSTGNVIVCPAVFPDTTAGLFVRKVYVLPTPPISIYSDDTICPNIPLLLIVQGDQMYTGFRWNFGDGFTADFGRPDTSVRHTYALPGTYHVSLVPTVSNNYACIDSANKLVFVPTVTAAFDIDDEQSPVFMFNNTSEYAVRYLWDFGHPAGGTKNQSTLFNGTFDYGRDTGMFSVCLMAFNSEDCWDSVCKEIRLSRYDSLLVIPNVFTPDNDDHKNDAFDIEILGFTKYELQVYNRWGTEVYRSNRDGTGNDGVNWNGRDHNDGSECSEGVYYFIFTYRFASDKNDKTTHGTITLIREK